MSRDDKAGYYDLTLPDGTVVEAQDVTRALLERAALPPYASKCLGTLLERVWRFGAKPDTDTAREAEKVVTEATFLCDALGGVPSFTMRDVARAAHDAGIEIRFSCDDPAARIAELERELEQSEARADARLRNTESARDRVAELERERDEARVGRRAHNATLAELDGKKRIIRETLQENANLRRDLTAEREAHEATRKELERVRVEAKSLALHDRAERQAAAATAEELEAQRNAMREIVLELPSDVLQDDERTPAGRVRHLRVKREQAAEELERVRKELADLRKTYDVEMEFRAEMRDELGAHVVEGFDAFLRRVCRELTALRDRYRPRRQGDEPMPNGSVLVWARNRWRDEMGAYLTSPDIIWTHQPPGPGEGE